MEWALNEFRYVDKENNSVYKQIASDAYENCINNTPGKSYVYMKYNTSKQAQGGNHPDYKVVIELFDEVAPKTCENFRQLCAGHSQGSETIGYKGTEIHRVVSGMYVQGGDIAKNFCK